MRYPRKLYSLYYRNRVNGKRWIRDTDVSLSKYEAIKHWTPRLIEGVENRVKEFRIRAVN